MTPTSSTLFNLYIQGGFLSPHQCSDLIGELSKAAGAPATLHGRGTPAVDERVRKVERLTVSARTHEWVVGQLVAAREQVGRYFGCALSTCEEPQFLRYREGDFFVAHQDGNTGMIQSVQEQSRKVSVVVFLNSHSEAPSGGTYSGGLLRFTEWRPNRARGHHDLLGQAGSLLAFNSEITHEVTPVLCGDRYSIVSWYG